MRKGFTIIELLVAVGVLGLLVAFSGYIFEVSIDSQRTAGANTEIMDKLRVICDQLNADFGEIRTDGYLVLQSRVSDRYEYKEDELNNEPNLFHDDKLYYFSTGDYQSWFDEGVESNTARIYFGHDSSSIYDNTLRPYVSEWSLARDVLLLTPGIIVTGLDDCIDLSFTKFKKDVLKNNLDDVWGMFEDNPPLRVRIDIANPSYADDVRRLMCENVGEIKIEWTDGTAYEEPPTGSNIYMLAWFGFDM
ncbi:MAG: type II secretion system protein, partial [Phycisphaerae bacterium]|nr:type II secretion system protein [Phycisphaerae bacterium]